MSSRVAEPPTRRVSEPGPDDDDLVGADDLAGRADGVLELVTPHQTGLQHLEPLLLAEEPTQR